MTQHLASSIGVADAMVIAQAAALNDRLCQVLNLEEPPLEVAASGTWRVDGVAGLLRLNQQTDLEVIPKFLLDYDLWREDFFLIAVLARTGRLLLGEEISAGVRDRGDLATLVARALIHMHQQNSRRPIRSYQHETVRDFSLDGEVDVETLALPDPDGFTLHRLRLSPANVYNATLKGALLALLPEVNHGDTRLLIQRQIYQLGPQALVPDVRPPALPARSSAWQPAYDLSGFVLDGMGLDLSGGTLAGPGFVLSTWSAWQSLCAELLRRAFPEFHTVPQYRANLGVRISGTPVDVRPDVALLEGDSVRLLLDAKYKTRTGRKPSVASTDLYEALAFMRASGTDRMILLYPAVEADTVLGKGQCSLFDSVFVDDLRIDAVAVQVRGLSDRYGFARLVDGLRTYLLPLVPDLEVAVAAV